MKSRRSAFLCAAGILLLPLALVGLYTVSIVWRVSIAEHKYFGRSELIPLLSLPARIFDEPAVLQSYGHKTYQFDSPCGRISVWRQKINGFQHMYGSALACVELGPMLSERLFCLNEFAEFLFDWNSVAPQDLLDRKKDLANNALGRSIGLEIRSSGITGSHAEAETAVACARAVESNPKFLPHYLDPRVFSITEEQYGCHFLPKENIFNFFVRKQK